MSCSEEYIRVAKRFSHRLLHPKLVVLVVAKGRNGKVNVMTAAWCMPVSINPPLVVVSISRKRYTYKLIKESREFVICIPTLDMLNVVHYFGTVSGRDENKISKSGVKLAPAKTIDVPYIVGSLAILECKVYKIVEAGDHDLVIGEVLEAYALKGCFKDNCYDIECISPIYHIGGPRYTTIAKKVLKPGSL
ncbi:MAG: flavin reductase family protein [Thermoprotei archaeon]|nr:MAG: flavin reductase family protein [Thermoprotei archaeon]RLF19174.1 MAG: flavin reductase family protein [Thermoprotei archaeon]